MCPAGLYSRLFLPLLFQLVGLYLFCVFIFWFKVKFIIIYGEMRIETHHVFKVSVFATHVNVKYFLLKILFPKYCIKVFFTYNMIVLLVNSVCCVSSVVVVVSVCCVGGCVVVGAWLFGCLGLCCLYCFGL